MQEMPLVDDGVPRWLRKLITVFLPLISVLLIIVPVFFLRYGQWAGYLPLAGLVLFILTGVAMSFVRVRRHTRSYLEHSGQYDLSTPRKYSNLSERWSQMLSAGFNRKKVLASFTFGNGVVRVEMLSGRVFEAPLNELQVFYDYNKEMPRTRMAKTYRNIYKFILRYGGDEVRFWANDRVFEREEWNDIYNILARGLFMGLKPVFLSRKSKKPLDTVAAPDALGQMALRGEYIPRILTVNPW